MTLLSTSTRSLLLVVLVLAIGTQTFLDGGVHAQKVEDSKPEGMVCDGGGAGTATTHEGTTCANLTYTFTPQCNFEDVTNDDGTQSCSITYEECGCVYWEEGGEHISGKLYNPNEGCDPCPFSNTPAPAPGSGAAAAATKVNGFVAVTALFMGFTLF